MTACIALLRAVNLPHHKQIRMSDLRAFLEGLAYRNVRSLLQSGNLLFETDERATAAIERRLETEAAKRLGLETDFFVRTAKECASIIERNPFPKEAARDPGHLIVVS